MAAVRLVRGGAGEVAAATEVSMQEQLSFLWMGELAALLGEYEADRETYPDFAAFMPRVIDFFADRDRYRAAK